MADRIPLVLLPGLLLDGRLWTHQAVGLADLADVRIGDLTRGETMAAIARSVLDAAPERFALAGLSMGGYVAQEILRIAPRRVMRLALLGTSARADSEAQTARRRDLIALVGRGEFRGVTPRLLPFYVHPNRVHDEAVTAPIFAMAEDMGGEVFVRQTRAVMGRADGRADLPRIDCPTLVLCGREDRAAPLELSLELADAIPEADLVVLGHCGHLSPLERPDAVTAQLARWLAEGR